VIDETKNPERTMECMGVNNKEKTPNALKNWINKFYNKVHKYFGKILENRRMKNLIKKEMKVKSLREKKKGVEGDKEILERSEQSSPDALKSKIEGQEKSSESKFAK
jgi:hypothetical protein